MRYSEQREKILLAVKNCCDHPTAEVIYSRVKAQMPDISMGTVYRNLRLLAEMGLVDTLETTDKSLHYDGNTEEHVHFICTGCNKITDVFVRAKIPAPLKDDGYHVTGSKQMIYGLCPECRKENKKFLYQTVKEGARAREYENALNWLNDANLIYKIHNVSKSAFPLKAYNDLSSFKIYMLDIGLLRRMSGLDSKIIIEGNKLFEEFKGTFSENYVLNMLVQKYDMVPNYYTFDRHEIDFMIQKDNKIIPIEVKSNKSTNNISLTRYKEKFEPDLSIRFSMNNFCKDNKIMNVPLFLIEYLDNFITK